jgi:hypothetical protein
MAVPSAAPDRTKTNPTRTTWLSVSSDVLEVEKSRQCNTRSSSHWPIAIPGLAREHVYQPGSTRIRVLLSFLLVFCLSIIFLELALMVHPSAAVVNGFEKRSIKIKHEHQLWPRQETATITSTDSESSPTDRTSTSATTQTPGQPNQADLLTIAASPRQSPCDHNHIRPFYYCRPALFRQLANNSDHCFVRPVSCTVESVLTQRFTRFKLRHCKFCTCVRRTGRHEYRSVRNCCRKYFCHHTPICIRVCLLWCLRKLGSDRASWQ